MSMAGWTGRNTPSFRRFSAGPPRNLAPHHRRLTFAFVPFRLTQEAPVEEAELLKPLRLLDQLADALENLPDECLTVEQRTLLIALQVRTQAMWNAVIALRDDLRGEPQADLRVLDLRASETLQ
jgi:hypothetical protein